MIIFKVNNNKTKVWHYKRLVNNLKPIIAIIIGFLIYGLVSTMEYYSYL